MGIIHSEMLNFVHFCSFFHFFRIHIDLKGFSHRNFFFSVFVMLFFLKSYAKKCFTVWRNYFSIKSYSTFSAKMFQAPFILYMVYCIPYMEVNVDFLPYMEVNVGRKKKKAKHGEMRWTPKQ